MKLRAAGLTDVGCVRRHNEDNILIDTELGLFVVADGLGGHAAGEVASQIVIDRISQFIAQTVEGDRTWPVEYDGNLGYDANRLRAAVHLSDQAIAEDIQQNPERDTMGSTVVACLVRGTRATLVHVGDSRAYRVNPNGIEQITRDHSWVAEQVASGILTPEEARRHPFRNVITQALGNGGGLEIEVKELEMGEQDRFLLCSDGLSGMLPDDGIFDIVNRASSLAEATEKLVAKAIENGGEDNISVVLFGLEPA